VRAWAILLGGLVVWALHFFVIYGIGSALPGRPEARWLVVGVTLPALAADVLILRKTVGAGSRSGAGDPLERWISQGGAIGAAISLVAVAWQCVPALAF
jgi:hypothetical protein